MARINCFTLTATAALVLTAGGVNALANDSNTVNSAEKAAPAGPYEGCTCNARKERIRGLEVQGREVLGHFSFGQVCRLGFVWQAR